MAVIHEFLSSSEKQQREKFFPSALIFRQNFLLRSPTSSTCIEMSFNDITPNARPVQ